MNKESHCKKIIDCSICPKTTERTLVHHRFSKGHHIPVDKCTQNCLFFILSGEILINSEEYPGTVLHAGQIILQAIGSKIELLALTDADYIIYSFSELPRICEERYQEIVKNAETPSICTPLTMVPRLERLMMDLTEDLAQETCCTPYLDLKCQELIYLLFSYYQLPQLSALFHSISRYTESFHYFVMQNYDKVKNVEEFANRGGYSTPTFRRLFKNMYGIPVYEWILDKKREGILSDLQYTKERITTISNRYGFDSLSHFAHFCKSSFGDSPRALRKKAAKGEVISKI
ncbi:AraC family transcriptional regulator [Bacteroides sp.]|uniref:helix-turn-helix transcriptional regulator n=1 Tax=Bacteroides sp. TaxID=29523 RepID=UPI001B4BA99C|nr:AraC family transcriptional regulator [Bacteroides sp.]MBP6065319.1 helix-turn-helix transcriptional regulator [Bacteroides sp.]MBP6067275.1 helix-turn-helix transcriptional regulator [Bacteroides sp.]MBP6936795.1 helix-turn-helix transcriptional regulator [Bacteroides sp.]MBP8621443.1 helix-turn-helix transcriptional regulator [Bacteroides sp.]MBP9507812.1 helix-turn-helix transcriptional regulator [Bacteroides sp.]